VAFDFIRTMRGFGYRFAPPAEIAGEFGDDGRSRQQAGGYAARPSEYPPPQDGV
jgi:hypothetical protein